MISWMPGRKHFTATRVPSSSSPKKTSAMLPLACGRSPRHRSPRPASCNLARTSWECVPGDQAAATCSCSRLKATQTVSGKMSRRVASHCESFTKQGPQRSSCAATSTQKDVGFTSHSGQSRPRGSR